MPMIGLKKNGEQFVLEFNSQDVSDEFLSRLLCKYRIEKIIEKSELTGEEAWDLSEAIKDDWFKNNKDWILKQAGVFEDESNC